MGRPRAPRVPGDVSRVRQACIRLKVTAANTIGELRDGPLDFQLIGFGQDSAGELYALVFGVPGPNGPTGAVMRLSQSRR